MLILPGSIIGVALTEVGSVVKNDGAATVSYAYHEGDFAAGATAGTIIAGSAATLYGTVYFTASTRTTLDITPLAEAVDDGLSIRGASLFREQMVVANRGNGAYAHNATTGTTASGSSSDGTAQKMMVRRVYKAEVDAIDLRLVLGNYAAYYQGLNDITVTAGIEVGGSRAYTAQFTATNTGADVFGVTFNGAASIVIPGGAASRHVVSDPVSLKVTAGQYFAVRLFVTVASAGQKFPLSRQAAGFSIGDGVYYNDLATDLTQSNTSFGSAGTLAAYDAICVLGTPTNGVLGKVVIALGDSITQGTSDTVRENYGYWERLFAPASVPFINCGRGGGTAADMVGALPRQQQLPLVSGCSHMVCGYGRNDVSGATALATLQAYLLSIWTYGYERGVSVLQTTVTPRSQSTDTFITVANQSAHALTHDEIRTPLNAWIRDGAPILAGVAVATGSYATGTLRAGSASHPLKGYVEVADQVETARDSGKWLTGAEGTATTTNGSPTLTAVTASAGAWEVGQKVVGTGIPASTYVGSVGAGTIGLVNSLGSAANATATASGVAIGAPFTDDGVHPNAWGHTKIAAALTAATIIAY
jgi:lysophospholipase L1-like esterase